MNTQPDNVNDKRADRLALTGFSRLLGELIKAHKQAREEGKPSPFVAMAARMAERAERDPSILLGVEIPEREA